MVERNRCGIGRAVLQTVVFCLPVACGARSLSPSPNGSSSGAVPTTTTGASLGTSSAEVTGGSADTATSGSTSAADDSDGGVCPLKFLVNVDLGSDGECDQMMVPVYGEECTTFNDTCPDGRKCNPSGACFRVADAPRSLFEPCTSEGYGSVERDDCARGLTCLDGICLANCSCANSAPHCDDPTGLCWVTPCLPACDPFHPDCPGDFICGYTPFGFFCSQGPVDEFVQLGEPCDITRSNCVDELGLAAECYGDANGQFPPSRVPGCTDDDSCCAELCHLPDGTCTQPGAVCVVMSDEPGSPECLGDVGVCLLPE